MREILFRGKRIDNGEWVYGNFVRGCDPQYAYIVEFGNKELCRNYVSVEPSTVGQFTGLTDKNGVKIFEGDIVKCHDVLIRCDEPFHEFVGAIGFKYASFMIADDCFTHYRWMDYEVEVIGNIHDTEVTE